MKPAMVLTMPFALAVLALSPGCGSPSGLPGDATDANADARESTPVGVTRSAEDAPGLAVGARVPEVTLRTANDAPFDLRAATARQPAVLVFYRGGWCPYCTSHLAELQEIKADLRELGYQVLAVSPDRPAELQKSKRAGELTYTLLSDSDAEAARAFGLAFRVDDATHEKYLTEYDIDIEAASGRTHHILPVPAVFLIDREGVIRFAHHDPDYKARLDSESLLAAARAQAN